MLLRSSTGLGFATWFKLLENEFPLIVVVVDSVVLSVFGRLSVVVLVSVVVLFSNVEELSFVTVVPVEAMLPVTEVLGMVELPNVLVVEVINVVAGAPVVVILVVRRVWWP